MPTSVPEKFVKWYDGLNRYSNNFPARGTISGALVVLERLKTSSDLDIESHTTKGGSQIKGASGGAIKRILALFGENRSFVSEGGRTNRGLRGDIKSLLDTIGLIGFSNLQADEKLSLINSLQQFLVERVIDYHNQQRIKFIFSPRKSTWENIHTLLVETRNTNKGGPVAQYLVGAKLAIRFPEIAISNESYSTADVQLGRIGDFLIGNTAIHVTLAPMPGLFEKCQRNIEQEYRPLILVPNEIVVGTKQNADTIAPGQIAIESLETFISQNIEELSEYSSNRLRFRLKDLFEKYNQRVNQVETDKSLMLEIPDNLENV